MAVGMSKSSGINPSPYHKFPMLFENTFANSSRFLIKVSTADELDQACKFDTPPDCQPFDKPTTTRA